MLSNRVAECSVLPGIIVSAEQMDGGGLGNHRLDLFSAIVRLQDVLQERYSRGQGSSSVLPSGGKPAGPNSSDVPGRPQNKLCLFHWDTNC